jgi:uncharacterized membrane protein YphA (DoxX/SURF4 family)
MKTNKIFYWILTLIVVVPAAGSGIFELFTNGPEAVVQSMHTLGYPLYLMKILGLAKIFGAIAILSDKSPRLKEWAYAGFTFDFVGATASHLFADDAGHAAFPFLFFLFLMGSLFFWDKIRQNKTS